GCEYIAGIDEAGRGPLAGPVVAAAVILPRDSHLEGLNDSKLLTEAQRNMFFEKIKEVAICYSIAIIDSDVIDDINIYEATKSAMRQAIHTRSEEHTSELQSRFDLVCRLLLEKKKTK